MVLRHELKLQSLFSQICLDKMCFASSRYSRRMYDCKEKNRSRCQNVQVALAGLILHSIPVGCNLCYGVILPFVVDKFEVSVTTASWVGSSQSFLLFAMGEC